MTQVNASQLWPQYSDSAISCVRRLLEEGVSYSSLEHPIITELERTFLVVTGLTGHAVYCGSGTAGLYASYFALGLGPLDEVLVPTNTFHATATPLLALNLSPVLCDCDATSGQIDLADAATKLSPRTRALVITHMWGHPEDMASIVQFVNVHKLRLIEDCSHAHFSSHRDGPVGSFGDLAVFSMGTKKLVSGGGGGLVVTRELGYLQKVALVTQPPNRAKRLTKDRSLRLWASSGLGVNFRGNPLQAALALDHVRRHTEIVATKNKNIASLERYINQYLPVIRLLPKQKTFVSGTWYAIKGHVESGFDEGRLVSDLAKKGVRIELSANFLHQHYVFKDRSIYSSLPNVSTSPLTPMIGALEFSKGLVGFDTRDLYVDSETTRSRYEEAFAAVGENLESYRLPVT